MPISAWMSDKIYDWIRDQVIAAGQDAPVMDEPPPRVMKLREVMRVTRLGKSTIYREMAKGKFPKQFHLLH